MEDEFGTSREEDVVQQILEKGTIVESEVSPNTSQDRCWMVEV